MFIFVVFVLVTPVGGGPEFHWRIEGVVAEEGTAEAAIGNSVTVNHRHIEPGCPVVGGSDWDTRQERRMEEVVVGEFGRRIGTIRWR